MMKPKALLILPALMMFACEQSTSPEPEQLEKFSKTITVKDGGNSTELIFGMDPAATDEYEEGIDRFAPPIPPDGAFFAHFFKEGENLLNDFRSLSSETTIWNLVFAPEEGRTITLEWDAEATTHIGTLILTDDLADPSFELDMKSQNSYEVPNEGSENLFVISN